MEDLIMLTTKKINSNCEVHIDNKSDNFKDFTITQMFNNESEPIVVRFQMDVLNKDLEINGIGLNKTEIGLLKEFLNQLRFNEL